MSSKPYHKKKKEANHRFDSDGYLICPGCTNSGRRIESKKQGGREFWACPKPMNEQCDPSFLGWCDEVEATRQEKPQVKTEPKFEYGKVSILKNESRVEAGALSQVLKELAEIRRVCDQALSNTDAYMADRNELKEAHKRTEKKLDEILQAFVAQE